VYSLQRPLHPDTVRGVFRQNDVRLTPIQLARVVGHPVSELDRLGVPVGTDSLIGSSEMSRWQ
jgi:hypothetical protein